MKLGSLRPDHAKRLCYIQRGCSQTRATIGAAPLSRHLQSSSPRRISWGTPGIPWGRDAKLPVGRRGGKFEPQGPRDPGAHPALLSVFLAPVEAYGTCGSDTEASGQQTLPSSHPDPTQSPRAAVLGTATANPCSGMAHLIAAALGGGCASPSRRCKTTRAARVRPLTVTLHPKPLSQRRSSSTKHQHQRFRSSLRVFSPDKDKLLSAF